MVHFSCTACGCLPTIHEQRHVSVGCVDIEMVSLISACRRIGIATVGSCQDSSLIYDGAEVCRPGAYIQFEDDAVSHLRFLKLAGRAGVACELIWLEQMPGVEWRGFQPSFAVVFSPRVILELAELFDQEES